MQTLGGIVFANEGGEGQVQEEVDADKADEAEYSIGTYDETFYAVWDVIKYKLSFVLTPENAKVVLKNSSNSTQYPESDGSYQLTAGTYTYTVSAEGYETTTGEIVLSVDTELPVALTKIPTYTVAFNISKPEDVGEPQITVTNAAGKAQTPEEDGTYSLMAGAYTYQIKAAGAATVRGSFTVENKELSFDVNILIRKLAFCLDKVNVNNANIEIIIRLYLMIFFNCSLFLLP